MFVYDKGIYDAVRDFLKIDRNKLMESASEDPAKTCQHFCNKTQRSQRQMYTFPEDEVKQKLQKVPLPGIR